MKKICSKCGKQYTELENYCTKCGLELERDYNRCSENKSAMCSHRTYADDDIYCAYCGSLTTYAAERKRDGVQ
jgi:ribosomal protein L37E